VPDPGGLRVIGRIQAKSPTPFPITSVLILGGYPFGEYEHPPYLTFGVTQKDVELEAIGGTLSSQDLGAFHDETSWTGYFRGPDAYDRALTYKRMAYKGGQYLLQFQRERYYVKVSNFAYTYHTPYFGEYKISVKVIRDASGQLKKANTPNIDQQTNALAGSANSAATIIASNDVSAAAANVQAFVTNATSSLPSISPIAQNQGNTSFLSKLNAALGVAQSYADEVAPYANLVSGVLPNAHIYTAIGLVNSLSLIGANVSSGQPPNVVQVFGGTFSALCALHYGDPTLWQALANVNGFASNNIPKGVPTNVKLPPFTGAPIA
jgi:hypothetical protein